MLTLRRALPWLSLLALAGCPKLATFPVEVKLEGALYAERCGEVTAEWLGALPEPGTPRTYGTDALRFRFADTVLSFTPDAPLSFSDWSYEIFSPDCQHALRLRSSHGPYHLVQVSQLRAYLQGAAPLAVVQQPREGEQPAAIHSQQRWLSSQQFEFFASCCGGVEVLRAEVGARPELQRVYAAAVAPKGLRRTPEGGFEVVP